jgi:hypothetical protein
LEGKAPRTSAALDAALALRGLALCLPSERKNANMSHTSLTLEFDDRLSTIPHYSHYPEMMVAVGDLYRKATPRILVLGESHYVDKAETSNHADRWYEGRNIACVATIPNICTRKIFDNAINGRKKCKSKAIFHSLASALRAGGIMGTLPGSPLQSIAYMNYFQRPAEESGKSLRVHRRDVIEATSVVKDVVSVIEPQLVVFASRLAWRHAKAGLADQLQQAGIDILDVPHPATSWWNRPSRPMKGQTGRQRLVSAVLTASSNSMVDRNTSTNT